MRDPIRMIHSPAPQMKSQRGIGAVRTAFAFVLLLAFYLLWYSGLSIGKHYWPPICQHRVLDHVRGTSLYSKRVELYEYMAADLDKNGAAFLDGGETSQSLKLSDVFTIVGDKVTPVHKATNPAVRASVLHLHEQYASKILALVEGVLSPHFRKEVWYQDPQSYHISLFHASHHLEPVPATPTEISEGGRQTMLKFGYQVDREAAAVEQAAKSCCPLDVVLDRVILTSTGVLLGCWQVLNGTDPATIREQLRNLLPQAPKRQLYAPEILHTSLARLLPDLSTTVARGKEEVLALLKRLVLELNEELFNFQATVKELWFVEEFDLLALALRGRMQVRSFPLQCPSP